MKRWLARHPLPSLPCACLWALIAYLEPGNPPAAPANLHFSQPTTDLASLLAVSVTSRLQDLTPTLETVDLYASADDATLSYSRNACLWCADVDLTCIPVQGNSGGAYVGVLVAPDILIQANHAHAFGALYFVDAAGNTLTNYVLGGMNLPGSLYGDVYVARLANPLPPSIVPAAVLPPEAYAGPWLNLPAATVTSRAIPVAFVNQQRQMRVGSLSWLQNIVNVLKPTNALAPWYAPALNGDSGLPVFLLAGNQPVVLGVWVLSDGNSYAAAPPIAQYLDDIQAAIITLGSTGTLSRFDLSPYTRYPSP